jgi:hypothetical protein
MPSKKPLVVFVASFSVILGSLAITTPLFAASREKVIHSFGKDGFYPNGVIIDKTGNLHGTTYSGGDLGSVFEQGRASPLEQQRLSLSGELPDAACISDFYCPTGLFIGTSVDAPHCCVMILLLLLCMTYQIPFDGRHTAKSALRSPS